MQVLPIRRSPLPETTALESRPVMYRRTAAVYCLRLSGMMQGAAAGPCSRQLPGRGRGSRSATSATFACVGGGNGRQCGRKVERRKSRDEDRMGIRVGHCAYDWALSMIAKPPSSDAQNWTAHTSAIRVQPARIRTKSLLSSRCPLSPGCPVLCPPEHANRQLPHASAVSPSPPSRCG